MNRLLLSLVVFSTVAFSVRAQQSDPVVRVAVEPAEIGVGESVVLTLEVLCPTWFAKPPRFPLGEVANAITRLPEGGARPTSSSVDGETWSGVVYNYRIYPLLGATYELGGESVGVACAIPGTIGGEFVEVPIESVSFRSIVPEGAESLNPYLSGVSLTLEQTIEGDPEALKVGDALRVTYEAELEGMPAMFLPPLVQIDEVPGVAAYPDQPIVEDGVPARRSESYTFVFEAGGEFSIPGARLEWWNREAARIESAVVDSKAVSVVGPPLPVPEVEEPAAEPFDWRLALVLLVALFVVWKILGRIVPSIATSAAEARARRLASERHAFEVLEKALLRNDRSRAQAALGTWLGRIAPGCTLTEFVERWGDAALEHRIRDISRSLYREGASQVDLRHLAIPLAEARRRVHREHDEQARSALPALNP